MKVILSPSLSSGLQTLAPDQWRSPEAEGLKLEAGALRLEAGDRMLKIKSQRPVCQGAPLKGVTDGKMDGQIDEQTDG